MCPSKILPRVYAPSRPKLSVHAGLPLTQLSPLGAGRGGRAFDTLESGPVEGSVSSGHGTYGV